MPFPAQIRYLCKLFYVNGSKEKNGVVPIMGRVTVNGQVAQFSCKLSVLLSLWDAKGNRAKGKGEEAQRVNHALDRIKVRIIKLYNQIRERNNFVSAEMVRNAYQGIGNEYETLLRAFDKFIAYFRKRVGKDRTADTLQKHCCVRNHVTNFIESYYKRKNMAMKELTEDVIRQYEIYLRTELGLMTSTIWMYTAPLKMIVTRTHCDGHLYHNPFVRYHVAYTVRERKFLTEDEPQTVMNHPFDDPELAMMRDIFVFDCLTGLSSSDVKGLRSEHLVCDNDGALWIKKRRQKTGNMCNIPLLDPAREILERYKGHPVCLKDDVLLPVISNQKRNAYLAELADIYGITKKISSHLARHSFATLALTKGMPIETVSKILGHSRITTTQIYAKMTNEKIAQDMDMFSKKLNKLNRLEDELLRQAPDWAPTPTIIQMPIRSRRSRNEAVN